MQARCHGLTFILLALLHGNSIISVLTMRGYMRFRAINLWNICSHVRMCAVCAWCASAYIYIYIYIYTCVCMRMFWSKRHKLQMCLARVLQKASAFEKRNPDTFVSNCQITLLFHPTCPRCSGKLGRTLGNLANVYCMLVGFCHPAKVRLISLSCRLASISVCSAKN